MFATLLSFGAQAARMLTTAVQGQIPLGLPWAGTEALRMTRRRRFSVNLLSLVPGAKIAAAFGLRWVL
jgi:hypothetical protein